MADYGETVVLENDFNEPDKEKKDNKIWIIVAVVVIVLCCCCSIIAAGLWYFWQYGDDIFNFAIQFPYLLL
jgi:cytochrome c-type biogenesis protein CcmH/NrfG